MLFRLGTFSTPGEAPFAGLVLDILADHLSAAVGIETRVVPISRVQALLMAGGREYPGLPNAAWQSVRDLLECWEESFHALTVASELETATLWRESRAIGDLQVHAPVRWPRQIFCAVANYRSQITESIVKSGMSSHADGMEAVKRREYAVRIIEERGRTSPYVCLKLPSSVAGPEDVLEIPSHIKRLDWEVELGVVIGRSCRRVALTEAMAQAAGYILVNDITARDMVRRADAPGLGSDWLQAKSGPGFLPTGPYLVPAAFVPDPYALRLSLALNGRSMQDELVSDMLFDIAALIEYISHHAQLLPGDIICTGTPGGCGIHHGRTLEPGDLIEARSPGLGVQRTRCIAQSLEADSPGGP